VESFDLIAYFHVFKGGFDAPATQVDVDDILCSKFFWLLDVLSGFPRIALTNRRVGEGWEREFSCNDVDHGNEILDGSESTCARLG
jgi:hypothetical protein